jgi:Flp pilus assembly protein TadG
MVEAAIVLPVLMLVVFGIIQIGYILAAYITLRNASAAGARVGVVNSSLAATDRSAYNTLVSGAVNDSLIPLSVSYVAVPTPIVSGDVPPKISVTVNYTLPLFSFSALVLGTSGSYPMTCTTVMR